MYKRKSLCSRNKRTITKIDVCIYIGIYYITVYNVPTQLILYPISAWTMNYRIYLYHIIYTLPVYDNDSSGSYSRCRPFGSVRQYKPCLPIPFRAIAKIAKHCTVHHIHKHKLYIYKDVPGLFNIYIVIFVMEVC